MSEDNRRSWRNYLVRPRQQVKFSLMLISSGMIIFTLYLAFCIYTISQTVLAVGAAYDITGEGVAAISQVLTTSFMTLISLAVALTAVGFTLCVRISHRFYGPLVPMLRQIESLRAGRYSERLKLRKDDEFRELEEALNGLAADLEKGK
jgi:signal transduction histidine kinase